MDAIKFFVEAVGCFSASLPFCFFIDCRRVWLARRLTSRNVNGSKKGKTIVRYLNWVATDITEPSHLWTNL